jgi:hypothetical protein
MVAHKLGMPLRVVMVLWLLVVLLPAAAGVGAASPGHWEEAIPRPPEGEALAPQPDVGALQGGMRTLHFPAQSLNYNPGPGVITPYGGGTTAGLQWTPGGGDGSAAFLNIPRPADWDGTGTVWMHLYFTPISAGSGYISFFLRPRAYDPGAAYGDVAGVHSAGVPYASGRVLRQSFAIPAERFGGKALWVIGIQRSDSYAGNVNLLAVELNYRPMCTTSGGEGFPANALNYNASLGAITPHGGGTTAGLLWAAGAGGVGSAAFLDIPRPADWDGSSPVVVRVYVKPTTSSSGTLNMFIRPRAYNVGDPHGDAVGITGSYLNFTGADVVMEQSFIIPADVLQMGSLWVIGIQRGGSGETYSGGINLLAVGISYTARPVTYASIGFPANALNYNPASGHATQYGGGTVAGLLWTGTGTAIFLNIPRPADWEGATDVTLSLYFVPLTITPGNIDFFLRPRAYDPGDSYGDAGALTTAPVAFLGRMVVGRQLFAIPAERLGNKELWVIAIERGGSGETYHDDVVLLGAEVKYWAMNRHYLPLVLR